MYESTWRHCHVVDEFFLVILLLQWFINEKFVICVLFVSSKDRIVFRRGECANPMIILMKRDTNFYSFKNWSQIIRFVLTNLNVSCIKKCNRRDFQIVNHHAPTNPERYRCRNREQSFKANTCYMMTMMISIEN